MKRRNQGEKPKSKTAICRDKYNRNHIFKKINLILNPSQRTLKTA